MLCERGTEGERERSGAIFASGSTVQNVSVSAKPRSLRRPDQQTKQRGGGSAIENKKTRERKRERAKKDTRDRGRRRWMGSLVRASGGSG